MRKIFLFVVVVLIAVAAYLFFTSSKNSFSDTNHKEKVSMVCNTWAGYGLAFVAQEKGFFEGIDVTVKIIDDMSAKHAFYMTGKVDILATTADAYAYENVKGLKGKVFLNADMSFGSDGIVSSKEITTIEEMKDKRIAFPRVIASHYLLYQVLKSKGLSMSDIQRIETEDPATATQALIGGSADVAVAFEPMVSQAKEKIGGNILATTRDFPNVILDVLVASETFSQKPKLLKKFLDGWFKALEFSKTNPQETAEIMAKNFNVSIQEAQQMLDGLQFLDKETNAKYLSFDLPSSIKVEAMLDEAGAFWISEKVIDRATPGKDLIYPDIEGLLLK